MRKYISLILCLFAMVLPIVSCDKDSDTNKSDGGDGKLEIKIVNNTTKTVKHLTIKDAANGWEMATPPQLYDKEISIAPSGTLNLDLTGIKVFKNEQYEQYNGKYVFVILATFTDDTKTNNITNVVPTTVKIRLDCELDP
jgi:hypothetical protein